MFCKIAVIFAALMIGVIASDDLLSEFDELKNFATEIDGDIKFETNNNRNKQIPHKPVHLETLELHKNVDGIMHYSLGARTSSTYNFCCSFFFYLFQEEIFIRVVLNIK